MPFKVEFLYGRNNSWTATGSYSSEQTAIFYAKEVAKRSGVSKVRISSGGSAVWLS